MSRDKVKSLNDLLSIATSHGEKCALAWYTWTLESVRDGGGMTWDGYPEKAAGYAEGGVWKDFSSKEWKGNKKLLETIAREAALRTAHELVLFSD